MEFKSLKPKGEFVNLSQPNPDLLETFPNPGVARVELFVEEFTSLCPITGQPDYGTIRITYYPVEYCLESKSLKLYLAGYRNYGAFCETLAVLVKKDLQKHLNCSVEVVVNFARRGGVSIEADTAII